MKAATHLIVVAEDNEPDVFLIRESLDQAAINYQLQVIDDGDEVSCALLTGWKPMNCSAPRCNSSRSESAEALG